MLSAFPPSAHAPWAAYNPQDKYNFGFHPVDMTQGDHLKQHNVNFFFTSRVQAVRFSVGNCMVVLGPWSQSYMIQKREALEPEGQAHSSLEHTNNPSTAWLFHQGLGLPCVILFLQTYSSGASTMEIQERLTSS